MNVPEYMHPHVQQLLSIETEAAINAGRISFLLRVSVFRDGDKWCALYGKSLQEGVAGFGDSPEEAVAEFNKAWITSRP